MTTVTAVLARHDVYVATELTMSESAASCGRTASRRRATHIIYNIKNSRVASAVRRNYALRPRRDAVATVASVRRS